VQEHIEVDQRSLVRLTRALRAEADGKALAADLVKELKRVAEPALEAVRASILSMGSHSEALPGLRATVAQHTKIIVRTGGKRPGVMIRADKTGMPRGFANAPKRLNSAKGWRHRVFGTDRWVTQMGKPGWFDDTLKAFKAPAKRAAQEAMDRMAKRIDYKTKG
jgi:hypothetical protein